MPIRITTSFQGAERLHTFSCTRISIGRPSETEKPDLDLSPDPCVSRHHAVLWVEDGVWRIQDVGSKLGTRVNGRELQKQTERILATGDAIRVGETTLHVETEPPSAGAVPFPETAQPGSDSAFHIIQSIRTGSSVAVAEGDLESVRERRLAVLCSLPLQFAQETSLDALLPIILERVVQVVPAAKRGALLLRRPGAESLLLKAYVSEDEPAVSETLARRALTQGQGFIWRRDLERDLTQSVMRLHIETGMYAPLLWQGRALGVLCVDSPEPSARFTEEDLRLVMSVAQYAALSLANHLLQEELRANAKLLERLLTNFSPNLRGVLLERARQGRLRMGGQHSEVTLLLCDLCGFTAGSANLDAGDIAVMVNDYLQALAQVVFAHDGTIDKYIGDAVLAVFGSPDPDPEHCEKAVRAAVAMQTRVEEVNARRAAAGETTFQLAIGVHCGVVFHGFIGTNERLEFTVMGDAVNRTSRYCSCAGPGRILISPDLYQRVFNVVQVERTFISPKEGDLPALRVKGLK